MISIPGPIPISIHPLFFLLAGLIGWLNSMDALQTLVWIGVIFVSILVHEMGHATTSIFFGQRPTIALVATGGLTQRKGPKLLLWKEFMVVFNGPLFGITLAFVVMAVQRAIGEQTGLLQLALDLAVFINIFWTFINLLPIGPLDGAVLLNIALEGALGSKGIKLGYLIGLSTGVLLGLLAMVIGLWILGAIFFLLSFESFRAFQASRSMSDEDRDLGLQALYRQAEENFAGGKKEEAMVLYQKVHAQAGSGLLAVAATERMAQIIADRGEFEEAFELLSPLEKRLSAEALRLLHRIAYYMRNARTVVKVGDRCFESDQSYETAFVNALAYALLKQPRQTVGWLHAAQEKGMPQMLENLQKKEFDGVRSNSDFRRFVESLGG